MNKEEQQKNREEWRRRIDEWEASGLTQVEYCNRNHLKASAFLYWRKKFSENKPTHPTFVEVPLSPTNRLHPIKIEIGRYCVEVDKGYDPAALEHIIGFLSRS